MEEQIRIFQKQEVIFRENEYKEACMFDILQGKVGIYKNYGTEQEKKLTELDAGKVVGEMGMLEGYPRSATAVALEDDTRLQVITADNFGAYFAGHEEKVLFIMQQLSRRIRELTTDYMAVCQTFAESMEKSENAEAKRGGLMSALKKFADIYRNMRK